MIKYVITYRFRNPNSNQEWSGIWMTNSLADVGAFYAMVERCGGTCSCSI